MTQGGSESVQPSAPKTRELAPFPPLPALLELLTAPPARTATLGFSEEPSLAPFHDLRKIDIEACFEAILVLMPDPFRPDLPSFVQSLRGRLEANGSLLITIPDPGNSGGQQSRGLPTQNQEGPRILARRLCNAGFVIRRDQALPSLGWRAIEARRDKFLIRSYRNGDEDNILSLFSSCFFTQRSLDHWRWKYAENPYGNTRLSQAFSPEGVLAAHYSGYPVPYWYAETGQSPKKFLALQMGDTMTDPRFRSSGRGRHSLLARTVRHFFAVQRDGSFGFFYGFNTGPIQRFCSWFIGGSRVEPVGFWSREKSPPNLGRKYQIERIDQIGSGWDRFFRRVAPHYGFLAERNRRYLEWRYLRCPDPGFVILAARRWGRLVGWSVFRRKEDRLIWGDALFDPRHRQAAASVLAAACQTPELRGTSKIDAWFSERPAWWQKTLRELRFERTPEPNGLAFMALPESETQAVEQLQRLYYTMGDGDLF